MKPFRTFLAVLAFAAGAAIAFAADYLAPVVTIARRAGTAALDFVLGAIELAHQTAAVRHGTVFMVRARAFVLRLIKRERPVVTASWRMCPST